MLIENVNRDPLRGVLHDRHATAYRPLARDEVPMTARDAATAHSDTEHATRTIADQRQQHAVSADLRRFLLQPLERFCFPLRAATEKLRAARCIQNGNFLVVLRRRSIDLHRSRINRWPSWRQKTGGTARATREKQHREPIPGQPVIRDRAMIDAKGGAVFVYQCRVLHPILYPAKAV